MCTPMGEILRRPGGRKLCWNEFGERDGSAVVYLHGTPRSRLSAPPPEALAGVRLITFDRPGYGRSDPVRRPSLLGVADDVLALGESLGLKRFAVVGFSGGAPYALACGARAAGQISAIAAVALTGPAWELNTLSAKEKRDVMRLRLLPGAARAFVRRHAAWYATDPTMLHASADDPREEEAAAAREGARQGSIGLESDWLATDLRSWGFRLADVKGPTLIWAGRKDPGRAVPDAEPVAARIPQSSVRIAEDCGHTPSVAEWRTIFATVTGRAERTLG
jgi:pimeloyl-ACP methyl ester carboxylesterase